MAVLTENDSISIPWRSPTVQVVLASTLLAPLGVPLISPVLPAFRDALALTDAQASLLVSTYFATGIVLSPFIGLLADRVGRRRVLVPCLFAFSLAGGAIAFVPDFGIVLAVRLVQGTAAAGIFITTVTLIGDAFEGVQRNAVLGVNTAVLSAGAAVYPLVGGVLATVSWNAPFLAYFLGLPVALFALWRLEEPAGERETRSLGYLRRTFSSLSGGDATLLYGTAFLTEILLFGAVFTALPFLLEASYGLSPVSIGLLVTASAIASAVVSWQNGRLARRVSDYRIIAIGYLCYGVGLLGGWLAASPLSTGVAMLVIGAGWGISVPSVDAAVSDLVPGRLRAGALSLRNSTTFLGRTAGPVVYTGLASTTGYPTLLFVGGVVVLAGGLVVLLVRPSSDLG